MLQLEIGRYLTSDVTEEYGDGALRIGNLEQYTSIGAWEMEMDLKLL